MFSLSQLPKLVLHTKKRLGRGTGSGKGAKSGRGTTRHQSARQDIALLFEGGQGKLSKKFPLLRGKSRNKSRTHKHTLTLSNLNAYKENTEISIEMLKKSGVVSQNTDVVKVVASGELTKPLIIKLPVSEKARIAIEKAGGTILV